MRHLLLMVVLAIAIPSIASAAGYREEFEREFLTKTWYGEQIEEDACIQCHASDTMQEEFRQVVDEWKQSWHAENRISCSSCHGGDPKDASMSMNHQRGFVGVPSRDEIPEFCGKCHIGILTHYLESGHGKALKAGENGPTCVTCHGAHNIQKASIDIINAQRCSQCHTYERARQMKQALFSTEKKIVEIEGSLQTLRKEGVYTADAEKRLFSTQAEFRALFHSIDATLVKERTDEFTERLGVLEKENQDIYSELRFRKNFSAFLMLLFVVSGVIVLVISSGRTD